VLYADPRLWRLLPFVGGGVLLLCLAIAAGETRVRARERSAAAGCAGRLLRRLGGRGPRLGIAEFVAVSMWRSPGFRARVLPLLGLPAGMVFLSWPGRPQRDGFVFRACCCSCRRSTCRS
jgi:hypothetical protein